VCPQEFGVSRKLPRSLQAELIQHFEAVYEHKSVFNEEAIMDDLPAHIRSRVVKVMYEDMIDNSMFFDGFELYNETAIMKICLKLKATVALDQDDIYCEGDIGEDMFFLQDGCVHMTAEREYLDEGLRTTSSLSRQDSTTRTQKESVLFVEFEYADHDTPEMNHQFLNLVREASFFDGSIPLGADKAANDDAQNGGSDESTAKDAEKKVTGTTDISHYKRFRQELDHVSGLFQADSDHPGVYTQCQSTHEQYKNPKVRDSAHATTEGATAAPAGGKPRQQGTEGSSRGKHWWTLEFRPTPLTTEADGGDALYEKGTWYLYNETLEGRLDDCDSQMFRHRVPLGRTKLRWLWTWRKPPRDRMGKQQTHQICPPTSIPVKIVELLDERKKHDYFGEMEMLYLGNRKNPRAREATASAQERCHLSRLTYTSWLELKALYPELMNKNEQTFKDRAMKRGTGRGSSGGGHRSSRKSSRASGVPPPLSDTGTSAEDARSANWPLHSERGSTTDLGGVYSVMRQMNSSGDSQYLGELAPAASIPSPHERKDRHMVPLLPGHPAGAGAVAAAAATTGTATSQQDAAYDRTLIRELFKLGSQVALMLRRILAEADAEDGMPPEMRGRVKQALEQLEALGQEQSQRGQQQGAPHATREGALLVLMELNQLLEDWKHLTETGTMAMQSSSLT
jgi:CRP-like cAMP-binding protein